MAGRATFLYVDERLIESIGGSGCIPTFVQATLEGPPWAKPGAGLCQKALQTLAGWRGRGLALPPYLAFLALFVLAVGVAGDFPAHAYYKRLWKLLGREDAEGTPPSFDRMLTLWDDLEVWSNRDRGGDLGVFSVRFAGNWIHVGLPKAQAILTEHERRDLTKIFVAATLDPTDTPNDLELAASIRRHGAGILRHSTLELLKDPDADPDFYSILLDIINTELEEWDGEWFDAGDEKTQSVARLCMRVDNVSKRAIVRLRVASSADFPQDGLTLTDDDDNHTGTTYECEEHLPGWSSPLRSRESEELNGAALDWRRTRGFVDLRTHWRVRFPARRVRIFVSGLPLQLPGLVEVWRLPRDVPFTVAAHDDVVPHLRAWNDSGEVALAEVPIIEGLPSRWRLYASPGAASDLHIRDHVPELALPSAARIKLVGGIKSSEGNSYFDFARPMVNVVGAGSNDQVWIGSAKLERGIDTDTLLLPKRLPLGEPITAEVRSEASVRRRLTFFLEDDPDWRQAQPSCFMNGLGTQLLTSIAEPDAGEGPWIAGALLTGAVCADTFPVFPQIPEHGHYFIVGRRVGEVVANPHLPIDLDWPAIWILDAKEGIVHFCGPGISASEPVAEATGDRQAVRLWREVVWNRRKRFAPLQNLKLSALWKRYLKVASVARG